MRTLLVVVHTKGESRAVNTLYQALFDVDYVPDSSMPVGSAIFLGGELLQFLGLKPRS